MSTGTAESQRRSMEEIGRLLEGVRLGRFLEPGAFGPPAPCAQLSGLPFDVIGTVCDQCSRGEGILSAFTMIRTLFETEIALTLAEKKKQTRGEISPSLTSIHLEMTRILENSRHEFTEGNQAEFWGRDVEFHARFWLAAGYPIVAGIVRALESRLRRFALPEDLQAMEETIMEHEGILRAISSTEVDERQISDAISQHVNQAVRRWFPEDFHGALLDAPPQPQDLPTESQWLEQGMQAVRELTGDLTPTGEARIREELLLQFRHAGKYVAYVDSWETNGGTRQWSPKIIAAHASFEELSREVEELRPHIGEESLLHIEYQPDVLGH